MIYYNYCMALGTARGGRPCVVAVIPFNNARKVGLLQEFYAVCASFHYPEIMAVSRALRIHYTTVEKWKYRQSFPRWDIAVDVIEWNKNGKPMVRISPSETPANMM